jgi:hypothetical protein
MKSKRIYIDMFATTETGASGLSGIDIREDDLHTIVRYIDGNSGINRLFSHGFCSQG